MLDTRLKGNLISGGLFPRFNPKSLLEARSCCCQVVQDLALGKSIGERRKAETPAGIDVCQNDWESGIPRTVPTWRAPSIDESVSVA